MTSGQTTRRPRRAVRRAGLAACGLLLCVLLAGCWPLSSDSQLTVHATFSDVADMVSGAPVDYLDVRVGSVRSITLSADQRHAAVTLGIDRSAHVPANVTAVVRRTTPLGERIISLEPSPAGPGTAPLSDGATLTRTKVLPGIQDLVKSGTDLFGALSASQIGVLLDEGAAAFGGKGQVLHRTLSDLDTIIAGYAHHTADIAGVITDANHLAASLAPNAAANAALFANLARTTGVLNDQADELLSLVDRLNGLARIGNQILAEQFDHITTQIHGLTVASRALASQQQALGEVLHELPLHNRALHSAVNDNFVNLFADIIVCGVPGGGSVPGSAASSCSGTASNPEARLAPRGPDQHVAQP